jgi:3-methylcrotonyl-CoA carboxylase alpha subunit
VFKKILIANRGEIACRVAATARRLGVRTVAVYSDADADALHVKACDQAIHIGAAAPRESYLCAERIIDAALAAGAEAVHPGYGFLSENEHFAQACAEAGLVFIGPPPSAIQAMGLKAEAKRLMAQAGVPLVPGYHGADQDAALLQREADAIGYPVLIKASAGGGGKGMRAVDNASAFPAALASCRREAVNSFGDGNVLIERYLTRPRHIEIQVFADAHGHCVYLFERDCSVQRRHQKVLEEAPAPGMSARLRREMGEAAVAAARAVGYVGAGTVEFIAEPAPDGGLRFYFMEMNTRLQVEHPVTEAITGIDLVEWQLRVAAGEMLPLQQHELQINGHAIEARLCAENTERDFLPSTGRLRVMRTPAATAFERGAVRLDAGVREGDSITPWYDPMIAKLIVWGGDRAQALARLDQALAQTHIVGLHTNVAFLRRVAASRSFAEGDLDTALIDRERAVLFDQPGLAVEWAVAGVLAHQLAAEAGLQGADPWSRRDGWRLHGVATRRQAVRVDGIGHAVLLEQARDGSMTLVLGERRWPLGLAWQQGGRYEVRLDRRREALSVYAAGEVFSVFGADGMATVTLVLPGAGALDADVRAGQLTAPMPGRLAAFLVRPGQVVAPGQPLAVLEAMKMEHSIVSPRHGTVQALLYAAGDQVAEGAELLQLAPL